MSSDWTVIGAEQPTFHLITEALVVTVPDLTLRRKAQDTVLEILDDADMPILTLEAPREIHALGTRPESGQLADRLSHTLAGLRAGVVLSPFSEASTA